jgi:hypothetical protein
MLETVRFREEKEKESVWVRFELYMGSINSTEGDLYNYFYYLVCLLHDSKKGYHHQLNKQHAVILFPYKGQFWFVTPYH